MRLPIVLRMNAAEWPLIRAFGLASVSLGFGFLAVMARGALWPVAEGEDARSLLAGTIAFLIAGLVAALVGSAASELLACPFARNLPAVRDRLQREIRLAGFVLFGIAAGLGAAREGALVGASWFLAFAAALGYSVGLVNTLTRFAVRLGGLVGLLLALIPMLLMPEIARAIANNTSWGGGFLIGVLAASLLIISTESCGALARRDGQSGNDDGRNIDVRLFSGVTSLRRAPRDGADRFQGTRRSDVDWVRALLHEQFGSQRGGLVGRAIRFAIATIIVTFLIRFFFHALAALRSEDAVTGLPREGLDLTGMSLDWFTKSFASRQEELIATNLVAVILGTVAWNRMGASATVRTPIARLRRAWVVWLATQAEELTSFIGVLVGFFATALIVAAATDADPWPVLSRFLLVTTAVFALLPVTRWMRLRWLDARASPRMLDPTTEAHAESQNPRAIGVYALSMALVIGGAILAIRLGEEAIAWLRTEIPPAFGDHATSMMLAAALIPIALLRWWWLVELRRFYRRDDIPT
jgi:hypothetical protein